MSISQELNDLLLAKGASVVGYGNLSAIPERLRKSLKNGVAIGVALTPSIINGISNGPTIEYYKEYERINDILTKLAKTAEAFLCEHGFKAIAQVSKTVITDEKTWSTPLPHKTVATRAGIGWIGNCALWVTEQFGSAIRLTSVLTDAGLETGMGVNKSKCGGCTICRDICPAKAVSGITWNTNRKRDGLYNAFACRKKARERSGKIVINESLCGLCILKCPWTQKYLKSELKS